ncbi:hypothetical protein AB0L50_31895 [Streptomyces flaveolus]|uniref:hypothetical protein n=1 Tax=Streptomyces flaveolus TaxID=67297 RepID=UPI0034389C39
MAGFLGPAGDLGEKRPTDPAATSGMSDGHRQNERLLAGMRLPAFVVPESRALCLLAHGVDSGRGAEHYAPSMWSESNNYGFENELDYLRSIKKDDSYTFTYPFEYIAKNYGNDNYDIGTADMVVRVQWNDAEAGYTVAYDVPEMDKIDPAEGNGDAASFYESDVYWRLVSDLDGMGIGSELRAI